MMGEKAELVQMNKYIENINQMNKKIDHLVIFQNEMLSSMNPIRPKTGHYRNEPVMVDQSKIINHENLMRAG